MHTDPLVKMANQIANFFGAMPNRAEALEGIAQAPTGAQAQAEVPPPPPMTPTAPGEGLGGLY